MKHLKRFNTINESDNNIVRYVEPFLQEVKDMDGVEIDWNIDEISIRLDFTDILLTHGASPSLMELTEYDEYIEASRKFLDFNLLLRKALNKIDLDDIYTCELYIPDPTWIRVFFEKKPG